MSVSSWQGDPPDLIQVADHNPLQPSSQVSQPAICPGLFRPAIAQDGYLVRIRVPGGRLTPAQCRGLATVCEAVRKPSDHSAENGSGTGFYLEVTNRANLQLRGLAGAMPTELLSQLQAMQLAAHPQIDHLRNLMASPTAGIDPDQLLDTQPLVTALNAHLAEQLGWAGLSAKFSVGFDGGERVSIQPQPNDLRFTAQLDGSGELGLHLHLTGVDPAYGNFWLGAEALGSARNCSDSQAWVEPVIATVTAIVQLYLNAVEPSLERKPRLKQVLNQLGTSLPQRLQSQLAFPLRLAAPLVPPVASRWHLGVHAQNQPQFSYIGLALPLGQVSSQQLRQLADLTENWGMELRLTPWRTLLLSQAPTPAVTEILALLADLGLDQTSNAIWSRLVACSGSTGCAAAATDTQADALAWAQVLATRISATRISATEPAATERLEIERLEIERLEIELPTVHISGCAKSCAYHGSSDFTLVGTETTTGETGYQLYIGDGVGPAQPFGQLVTPDTVLPAAELPQTLLRLLGERAIQSAPEAGLRQDAASASTAVGGG